MREALEELHRVSEHILGMIEMEYGNSRNWIPRIGYWDHWPILFDSLLSIDTPR